MTLNLGTALMMAVLEHSAMHWEGLLSLGIGRIGSQDRDVGESAQGHMHCTEALDKPVTTLPLLKPFP